MNRRQLTDEIRADWPAIWERAGAAPDLFLTVKLPKRLQVLGSSTKTKAGEGWNILTAVVYMAPADALGGSLNVCPNATAACRAGCLGENSGRMSFDPSVKNAQAWKTVLRMGAPKLYFQLLALDLRAHQKRADRAGMLAAARLDGTSDLGDAERFCDEFPRMVFYEYTKSLARAMRWQRDQAKPHVTLSFSGENAHSCVAFLAIGGNVAVPFDYKKGEWEDTLRWHGFETVDGDEHDARFLDGPGKVVALSWKGPKAKRDEARANGWLQQDDPWNDERGEMIA